MCIETRMQVPVLSMWNAFWSTNALNTRERCALCSACLHRMLIYTKYQNTALAALVLNIGLFTIYYSCRYITFSNNQQVWQCQNVQYAYKCTIHYEFEPYFYKFWWQVQTAAYRRSASESTRPTSAPNAVDPPQLLGRSAPSFGSFRPDQTAPNLNWNRH